jgi:hypothetical protein
MKDETKDPFSEFTNFLKTANIGDFLSLLKSVIPEEERYPYDRLGNGFELRPIQVKNEKGELINLGDGYSHLYRNNEMITDLVFRKGGMGGPFKDGYCSLIHYKKSSDPKKRDRYGFDFGKHVIIDEHGNIKLEGGSFSSDHPYHVGGHLASINNSFYDLRTGKIIAPKSSSTMKGKTCLIFEHRYDWYDKNFPLGIYRIDFSTLEITKIDDVK